MILSIIQNLIKPYGLIGEKMKTLLRPFLFCLTMFCTTVAFAAMDSKSVDAAGFGNLTPEQQTAILNSIAQQAAQAERFTSSANGAVEALADPDLPDKIDKWVSVGTNIGKAMGGAAKELGVQINEFVKTDIGKITAALIIWTIIGSSVTQMLFALLVLCVGCYIVQTTFNRRTQQTIEYDLEKRNIFGNHPVIKCKKNEVDGDTALGFLIAHGIVIGISMWIFLLA